MDDDDALLVAKYIGGDTAAFETLYRRYQAPLFNYIYRSCLSAAVAEDIFQEVFFQVIKKMASYTEKQNFRAWIYTIARNRLIDRGRLKSSADVAIGSDWEFASGQETPVAIAEKNEERSHLRGAIEALPAKVREIMMLRHFSGLSFKEIAEVTSLPLGTVLSTVHRGLGSLREKMV